MNQLQAPAARILFLGFDQAKTKLIDLFIRANMEVWHTESEINDTDGYDFVISFGYRHILTKSVIDQTTGPILNLHMSYLPYNKGAHPNFWSFYDGTPSGVSIHLIDYGIDTGEIVYQREVEFQPRKQTFSETYDVLIDDIEALFIDNFDEIFSNQMTSSPQQGKGTYHRMADFPEGFQGWDSNIDAEIARLKHLNATMGG